MQNNHILWSLQQPAQSLAGSQELAQLAQLGKLQEELAGQLGQRKTGWSMGQVAPRSAEDRSPTLYKWTQSGKQNSHSHGKAAKLHFHQEGLGLWPLIHHDRHDLGANILDLRVAVLQAVLHQQLVELGVCPLQVRVLLPASDKHSIKSETEHTLHLTPPSIPCLQATPLKHRFCDGSPRLFHIVVVKRNNAFS